MQRREYESSGKEGQSCWYACQQRRPLRLTEHRYQREAKEDVAGRKHYVLPVTVADLRKQILNQVHRRPPTSVERCTGNVKPALWPNQIGSSAGIMRLRRHPTGRAPALSSAARCRCRDRSVYRLKIGLMLGVLPNSEGPTCRKFQLEQIWSTLPTSDGRHRLQRGANANLPYPYLRSALETHLLLRFTNFRRLP